jgi:hypothetical protein
MSTRCYALASVLFLALAASGSVPAAERAATRGELALQIVRAAGLRLPAAGTERAALQELKARGVDLGTDPARPATQGDLARIGALVGAAVTAPQPGAPVTPGKARAFTVSIQGPLKQSLGGSAQANPDDVRISCQGRNSRAGRKGTPASPADPNATAPPCDEEPLP